METRLTYANFSQGCKLGTAFGDQHIVRSGSVGIQVLGQWAHTDNTITVQELYRISWPVRLLFPTWVVGLYQPVTVWIEHIAPEVNQTTGAFVGELLLFEGG